MISVYDPNSVNLRRNSSSVDPDAGTQRPLRRIINGGGRRSIRTLNLCDERQTLHRLSHLAANFNNVKAFFAESCNLQREVASVNQVIVP